jgi:transposase
MELHVLHKHGWSISRLAREFGLNRRTVKREIEAEGPRRYRERAKPTALSPAQLAHVERRLAVHPGIRGTDLRLELAELYGYTGSVASFERHLRRLRPSAVKDPEIRFETDPGVQTQADWANLGLWPVDGEMRELHAFVTILGYSRVPAVRFALDQKRVTTFDKLALCLDDLGGMTRELLTDRDTVFCIGQTSDGGAILAPEWADFAGVLGVVPKACRPYRAKTKGKVERMVREVKEAFVPWLTGQVLPARLTLDDYDRLVQRWIRERVLRRRHRTTGRIVGEAWAEERRLLTPLPARVLASVQTGVDVSAPVVVDITQKLLGEHVEQRDLSAYEVAL